jgi:hypothetical protein
MRLEATGVVHLGYNEEPTCYGESCLISSIGEMVDSPNLESEVCRSDDHFAVAEHKWTIQDFAYYISISDRLSVRSTHGFFERFWTCLILSFDEINLNLTLDPNGFRCVVIYIMRPILMHQ